MTWEEDGGNRDGEGGDEGQRRGRLGRGMEVIKLEERSETFFKGSNQTSYERNVAI